jgi:hypothetical protein
MTTEVAKRFAFAFYQLRTLFKALYDDGFSDFKALVILLMIECFVMVDVGGLASILVGRLLLPTTTSMMLITYLPILLAFSIANYELLLKDQRWAKFKGEFDSYSTRTQIVGWIVVIGFIALSLGELAVIASITRTLPK